MQFWIQIIRFLHRNWLFLVYIFGVFISTDSGVLKVYTTILSMSFKGCKEIGQVYG